MSANAIRDYLSILLGQKVELDEKLSLSSARKAQLASWLRSQNLSFDFSIIDRPQTTVREIASGHADDGPAPISRPTVRSSTSDQGLSAIEPELSVGIDMEVASSLPETHDFRAHRFYADNFTAEEIAHAVLAADPRLTLCGIWAAKESIIKAGLGARSKKGHLGLIAISHDATGRPTFPGCALSVSHTNDTAIAICIAAKAPK